MDEIKDMLPRIPSEISEEDLEKITEEIEEDLDSLDGYLERQGLNMDFFTQNLKESFDNLKKGSTENRLHLDMLAKLRAFYKQTDSKVEDVKYKWGEENANADTKD